MNPTMTLGQSVELTAQPTPNGAVFPGDVNWSFNIVPSSAAVLFSTLTGPVTTVTVQTINGPCTMNITATSGMLSDTKSFDIVPPQATGLVIQVGPIQ